MQESIPSSFKGDGSVILFPVHLPCQVCVEKNVSCRKESRYRRLPNEAISSLKSSLVMLDGIVSWSLLFLCGRGFLLCAGLLCFIESCGRDAADVKRWGTGPRYRHRDGDGADAFFGHGFVLHTGILEVVGPFAAGAGMAVFQMLAEVVGAEKLLGRVAFAEFVDVVEVLGSDIPFGGVGEFLTAVATHVSANCG